MSIQPGADATFRVPREAPVAEECTARSCELSGIVTDPAFVGLVAVAGLVAFVAFAYLEDAAACCREERQRVDAERDAFEEFAERVASFEPVSAGAAVALDGPVVGVQPGAGFAGQKGGYLDDVLGSYAHTVMALPHYREEYDESAAESLAAELGADTVQTLSDERTLSPALQSALVTRSRHAAASRAELADAISVELDELSDAEVRLLEIDRARSRLHEHLDGVPKWGRTDALIDVYDRLEGLEAECDDLAKCRQGSLRDPPMTVDFGTNEGTNPTFYRYLYGPLSGTNYPVLASITELVDRLRRDRDRIVQRIAEAR